MIKLATVFFMTIILLFHYEIAVGYDDQIAHPTVTELAVQNSIVKTKLIQQLGPDVSKGYDSLINGKSIVRWIRDGSTTEDKEPCRRASHMHDPTKDWNISYMSDFPPSEAYCLLQGWGAKPYSNITWATGYLGPAPGGQKQQFTSDPRYAPNNWDNAREYYYRALTGTSNLPPPFPPGRDRYFVASFQALGQVLHLLQDVSVPAHTRNDFMSHLFVFDPLFVYRRQILSQPYETYVRNLGSKIDTIAQPVDNFPTFDTKSITGFWDTDIYNKSNPSGSLSIGLAEYSNANFFSDWTIFKTTIEDSAHSFPYPAWSSVQEYEVIDPITNNTKKYFKKVGDGETLGHLAVAREYYSYLPSTVKHLGLELDDACHEDYARKLLPRAVGYSAALLDYFFRGNIEITLPSNGAYGLTTDPAKGFTKISLLAENKTENNEAMPDGSIELVVRYKLAKDDPFQSYPVETDTEFTYIVVSEATGKRALPSGSTVELTFGTGQDTIIPLRATNVYLQVVYKGRLGSEDGAVAVGFKDISEPTPIDIYNNMDKICLNGTWYDAGSQQAIAQVDSDGDGVPEWDIYPHNLKDIYYRISSVTDPQAASSSLFDAYAPLQETRGLLRALYILGDYQSSPSDFRFHYSFLTQINGSDPRDSALHLEMLKTLPGNAIKNQTDYAIQSDAECANAGTTAPCDIRYYPLLYPFRGTNIWGPAGFIVENIRYPADTSCSWDLLQ